MSENGVALSVDCVCMLLFALVLISNVQQCGDLSHLLCFFF